MKHKTKTLLSVCCAVLMLGALTTGAALTVHAETAVDGKTDWSEPAPASWTINDDGTATTTGTAYTGDFLLTQNAELVGDYSVETTFHGSMDDVVTQDIHMGIVPWYLDAQNYVMFFVSWKPSHGLKMLSLEPFSVEGGVSGGWDSRWLDFSDVHPLAPTDTITLKVDKVRQPDGTDLYSVTISGTPATTSQFVTYNATKNYALSAPYAAIPAKAGVYAWNDTVTFTSFKTTSLTETNVYKTVAGTDTTAISTAANGWTYAADAYTLNATGGTAAQNQAILQNEFKAGNYQFGYTASVAGDAEDKSLSILPLYEDENNFVRFTLTKTTGGGNITLDGKAAGADINASSLAVETGFAEKAIDWTNVALAVKKEGTTFTLEVNGEKAATYTNEAFLDGALVGMGGGKGTVTFSSITHETLEYVPYSWYNEGNWYLSANAKADITMEEGTITLASTDGENLTRGYTGSGKYGRVSVSGTFTMTAMEEASATAYGFYLRYASDTEYVLVKVSAANVVVEAVNGGEPVTQQAALEGFDLATEHTLFAEATYGNIVVKIDNEEKLTATVAWLAEKETGNIGVAACGGTATIEDFTVGGFTPYDAIEEGDYTLYGSRLNSWTVEDSKVAVTYEGGTAHEQTIALAEAAYAPSEGYYFGASVKITALDDAAAQYQAGLMPYYKDRDNFIFVWLNQWKGAATTLTLTAHLNGEVVGQEWRETAATFNMQGEVNYLEIQIEGDALRVYLNKSSAATYGTTFEGLSAVTEKAYYGLNAFNTSVEFGEIQMMQERIFRETELPTIELSTSMPTSGTVGTEIKLPVATATTSTGTAVEVETAVTDPDGNEVTVSRNRFTPAKAGEYTVTLTATDVWGNTKTETYTITVAGTGTTPGGDDNPGGDNPGGDVTPGGDKPADDKGCGSVIGVTGGVLMAAVILAAGIVCVVKFGKKKE